MINQPQILGDSTLTVRNMTTGDISMFHIAMLTVSHFRSLALGALNTTAVVPGLPTPPADLAPWVAYPSLDRALTPRAHCPGADDFWQVRD